MRRLLLLAALLVPAVASAALIKGNLKKKDVTALAFDPPSMAICPGVEQTFEIVASTSDGKTWSTKGQVVWAEYTLSFDGGAVENKGGFSISPNPVDTWGKTGKLKAVSENHPDKSAEASVTAVYNCPFFADHRGSSGAPGHTGAPGSRGETGGPGTPGGEGARGGKGQKGHDVEVFVDLVKEPVTQAQVLQVRVHDRTLNTDRFYAVDPNGGTLTVDASGGRGGDGGTGGIGGGGGGAPANGKGGNGGIGGNGGDGGEGGTGGSIVATFSEAAKGYVGSFTFKTDGGPGGDPGGGGGGGQGGPGGNAGPKGQPSPNRGAKGDAGSAPVINTGKVDKLW